jgi:hypothetical protein
MLTEKQLTKLHELAQSEQGHYVLARGMLDAREQGLQNAARMRSRVSYLKDARGRTDAGLARESVDRELADLEQQIKRQEAADAERQRVANEHIEVANGLTATLDGVLRFARTTRRAHGLDFWKGDPDDRGSLGLGYANGVAS